MRKQKITLNSIWLEAKELIQTNSLKEAEQKLDEGILYLAFLSENGHKDTDLIEGIKMSTWYERFWIATENHIWPTKPNYEKDFKIS